MNKTDECINKLQKILNKKEWMKNLKKTNK